MSQKNFVSYDDATSIVTEVASKIAEKQDVLSFDNSPTQNSNNPVKSGGVYTALASKANTSDIGTAAAKNFTTSVTSGSNDLVTSGAVYTAIDNLPEPMVFKGSLGTGGTITALPVNGTATVGDTYKVITAGTYASKAAKVGDTFICLTKTSSANTWELIPSGDEPSGTVTSVTLKATSPIAIDSSSAITTSGTRTLSHANSGATAGSYGDSGNQTPGYGSTFKVPYVTVNATGHVTAISEHTVKIPASDNTNTTYTFANGTNQFTVTPSGGSAQTVTVTPSFTVTTGDSNGQVKVNGTNASVKGLGSAAYTSNDNIVYKNTDIPEGSANLSATATTHKITTYRNGFTIPYQMDNTNDGGIIRCRGTSENNCIFEMGTWDDSGGGETIQFNYYPTTSQVTPTYSVEVPKKSGTIALTSDIKTYTAATAAPGAIASAGSAGSSTNYARQDHTHAITVATGDSNGQVKIAGQNASVKGLGSAAYTASTAYAAASHTHSYLPLSGGTMTGQILTSFKSAVAMGSRQADAATIENLCNELRYSSGCAGSAFITTAYTKNNVTIPAGWYNYLWMPHRSGGSNGSASGDNCNYGSLLLSGMTLSGCYMIRYSSSAISELKNLYANTTLYGTCSTAAGTKAKVVTCSNFDTLITGVTIHVKFSNENTADSPTLNVNSTGAKAIWKSGGTIKSSNPGWMANEVVSFTYDGTRWIMNDVLSSGRLHTQGYNNNCDTSMMTCSVAGRSASLGGLLDVRQASQDIFTIGAMTANVIDAPAQGVLINQSKKTIYPIIGIDNLFSSVSGTIPVGQYVVLCNFRVIYTHQDFA